MDNNIGAMIADAEVTGRLVADAMREDGLLPTLPTWQSLRDSIAYVMREIDSVVLTTTCKIQVHNKPYSHGTFQVYGSPTTIPPLKVCSPDDRRADVLRFMLAEVEKALPVLRAMVERLEC